MKCGAAPGGAGTASAQALMFVFVPLASPQINRTLGRPTVAAISACTALKSPGWRRKAGLNNVDLELSQLVGDRQLSPPD